MSRMTARFGPRWLSGFVTIWLFAIVLICGYLVLRACGKVRVVGYDRAVPVLRRGSVIIAANHPDGFTPFLITMIFWRRYLFQPRFCFWNLPREGLVPTRFLRWIMRCILIERGSRRQMFEASEQVKNALQQSGNILVFPEGTRTADPDNPSIKFVCKNGRRIRRIKSRVPFIAREADAKILPVWINMPDVETKLYFWTSITHLFKKRGRFVTISFGDTYRVGEPLNRREENERLANKILTV
jgi:1-acyl-sn-glycerol-3-phosphate acyltransferase